MARISISKRTITEERIKSLLEEIYFFYKNSLPFIPSRLCVKFNLPLNILTVLKNRQIVMTTGYGPGTQWFWSTRKPTKKMSKESALELREYMNKCDAVSYKREQEAKRQPIRLAKKPFKNRGNIYSTLEDIL